MLLTSQQTLQQDQVVHTSQENYECMKDFHDSKGDRLLARATALHEEVVPLVGRTEQATGVATDTRPFPERPWLDFP